MSPDHEREVRDARATLAAHGESRFDESGYLHGRRAGRPVTFHVLFVRSRPNGLERIDGDYPDREWWETFRSCRMTPEDVEHELTRRLLEKILRSVSRDSRRSRHGVAVRSAFAIIHRPLGLEMIVRLMPTANGYKRTYSEGMLSEETTARRALAIHEVPVPRHGILVPRAENASDEPKPQRGSTAARKRQKPSRVRAGNGSGKVRLTFGISADIAGIRFTRGRRK